MDPVLALVLAAWCAVAFIVVGALAAAAVHEGGHALAAWAAGGRDIRLEKRSGGRLAVSAALGPGVERRLAFVLGGLGANIVVGGGLVAVAAGVGGLAWIAGGFGVINVMFAFVNAIPHGTSDGAQLLAIARDSDVARNDETAAPR